MSEKTTTEETNPKNIMLVNPVMPGQTRRARKTELKWFAERGWKPVAEKADAGKTKNA